MNLSEATGLDKEQIRRAWGHYQTLEPLRKIHIELLKAAIEEQRTALESAAPQDVPKIQGKTAGLRAAAGLLFKESIL